MYSDEASFGPPTFLRSIKIRKHFLYRVSKPGQNWPALEQNVVRAEGLEPSWAV
jgi:hypothetical protein